MWVARPAGTIILHVGVQNTPAVRGHALRWQPEQAALAAPILGVVRRRFAGVSARDVVAVVAAIEAAGSGCVVAGGWGVDALAGRQRRRHRDLDLVVDDGSPEPATTAARVLDDLGFGLVRTERVETAYFADRRLYEDRRGTLVDVHPAYLGAPGAGGAHGDEGGTGASHGRSPRPGVPQLSDDDVTIGTIGGRKLACLSLRRQLALYGAHPHRSTDRADLQVLAALQQRSPGS